MKRFWSLQSNSYKIEPDLYMLKLDHKGNKIWEKALDANDAPDYAYTIISKQDSGYTVFGKTVTKVYSDEKFKYPIELEIDLWALMVDNQGNKQNIRNNSFFNNVVDRV